ncbi:MAG: hypothetical protein P9X24_09160 [Candidatus Hatepunaea meridiana]|nr:hypothetical protein [Candidatus Hatepunaea meridiana]
MVFITLLGLVGGIAIESCSIQTFFIYTDNEVHEAPADKASIPLCTLEDTTQVVAYLGSIWGEFELPARDYCLVWWMGTTIELDDELAGRGYRKMPEEEK